MRAKEFTEEYYDIDPDKLHKAAYLQRAVDKYNSRYQNKKPLKNPNNPDDVDEPKTPNPLATFGNAFVQQLTDPEYKPPTLTDKLMSKAQRIYQGAVAANSKVSGSR